MPYTDFDGKKIKHSWGRFKMVATAITKVGDLLNFDGALADADVPTKATCIACEDAVAGQTISVALGAVIKKPRTIGARGIVSRANHGGAVDTILFLSTTAGKLTETVPTTNLKQPCALVISQDEVAVCPAMSMVLVEAAAFETTPTAAAHANILRDIGMKRAS